MKCQPRNVRRSRLSHTDRSVMSRFKQVNLINLPLSFWKFVVVNPAIYSGWAALIKMCIVAVMYAYRLTGYGAITPVYEEKCLFCGKEER
ncbi:putative transposable element encoded protein [Trachipleistophora hominis]|uniref:Putative transposable element encoded protein n=1 Tax=Trachipleistophora hominis TaxID=72359 RepID=L7JYQ5_TRAHO|nr:putative transposable element encoded protein [Trachipleistophora hominis]